MTKVRVGRSFRKGIKGQTTEGKVVRLVNNGPVGSDVIYGWASRVGRHLWMGPWGLLIGLANELNVKMPPSAKVTNELVRLEVC